MGTTPVKDPPVIDKNREGCVYGGFGRAIFDEGKDEGEKENDQSVENAGPVPQFVTYFDSSLQRDETVLVVKHLLSPEECQRIIASTEELGFEDLTHLYRASYRNNTRVMVESTPFVDTMFERLKPHLDSYAQESVRLAGTNDWNETTPVAFNPRMRICKYSSEGIFQRHQDGNCVLRKKRLQSYLTVMVYLNDVTDTEGGATRFYGREEDGTTWQVKQQVQPQAGLAVIFPHRLWHDGELCKASKYILRSDVLYPMDTQDDEW